MYDPVDGNAFATIIDCEQNSVITDSQPITCYTSEFFNLSTAWVYAQLFSALENEATLLGGDAPQVPVDTSVVGKAVHALNEPLAFQALKQLSV